MLGGHSARHPCSGPASVGYRGVGRAARAQQGSRKGSTRERQVRGESALTRRDKRTLAQGEQPASRLTSAPRTSTTRAALGGRSRPGDSGNAANASKTGKSCYCEALRPPYRKKRLHSHAQNQHYAAPEATGGTERCATILHTLRLHKRRKNSQGVHCAQKVVLSAPAHLGARPPAKVHSRGSLALALEMSDSPRSLHLRGALSVAWCIHRAHCSLSDGQHHVDGAHAVDLESGVIDQARSSYSHATKGFSHSSTLRTHLRTYQAP